MASPSSSFRETVYGYIRNHEKDQSVNIPMLIKCLAFKFYELKEKFVPCWYNYPTHWIYSNGKEPRDVDWTTKTDFDKGEMIGFRNHANEWVQAEVIRSVEDSLGNTLKIFISTLPSSAAHAPHEWVNVPNLCIRAPHLIDSPHWNGVSGSLPFGLLNEGVAEYRWTFQMVTFRSWVVGVRPTQRIIPSGYYRLSGLCTRRIHIKARNGTSPNGEQIHVVVDVTRQTLRVEGNIEIFEFSYSSNRSLEVVQMDADFISNGKYILVADQGYSPTQQPFTMEQSENHIKFLGLSIKQC